MEMRCWTSHEVLIPHWCKEPLRSVPEVGVAFCILGGQAGHLSNCCKELELLAPPYFQPRKYCNLYHLPYQERHFDRKDVNSWTWVKLAMTSASHGPADPFFHLDVRMTDNPVLCLGPFLHQALNHMPLAPRRCPASCPWHCDWVLQAWWCMSPFVLGLSSLGHSFPCAICSFFGRAQLSFLIWRAPLWFEPGRCWGFRREERYLCFWKSTSVE